MVDSIKLDGLLERQGYEPKLVSCEHQKRMSSILLPALTTVLLVSVGGFVASRIRALKYVNPSGVTKTPSAIFFYECTTSSI